MVFDQAAFRLLTISYNCQLVNWCAYNESLVRRREEESWIILLCKYSRKEKKLDSENMNE